MPTITYKPSPTAVMFHNDPSPIRAIWGPVGAGKTVAAMTEVMRKAQEQEADDSGRRRTRFAIIRQNYPQLKTTVVKTFEDWFGSIGTITYGTPITYKAQFGMPDRTTVEIEVLFLALERAEDVAKLRSLELSHAVMSEAAEIPAEVLEMLRTRVGRFPAVKDGAACTRPAIWMESNPPSTSSHWYQTFEVSRPKGFRLFRQPPALLYDPDTDTYSPNPEAENIEYLPNGYEYYLSQIPGSTQSFIDVYILGQYGSSHNGQKIYQQFNERVHTAAEILKPVTRAPLVVGMDFGLHAAAAVTQLAPTGALHALGEACGEDEMFEQFLDEKFMPLMRTEFAGWPFAVVGDPSDNTGKAAYTMLHRMGVAAIPAATNDPIVRWDSVKWFLSRQGGFLMSPACTLLADGFAGGYHFKKKSNLLNAGSSDRAEKTLSSHPHDALQYAAMEHRRGYLRPKKPAPTRKKFLWA